MYLFSSIRKQSKGDNSPELACVERNKVKITNKINEVIYVITTENRTEINVQIRAAANCVAAMLEYKERPVDTENHTGKGGFQRSKRSHVKIWGKSARWRETRHAKLGEKKNLKGLTTREKEH